MQIHFERAMADGETLSGLTNGVTSSLTHTVTHSLIDFRVYRAGPRFDAVLPKAKLLVNN